MDTTKPVKQRGQRGISSSTPASNIPALKHKQAAFTKLPDLSESFEIPHASAPVQATTANIVGKKTANIGMICAAIQAIGLPRKGASYVGIKKWILDNNENMDPTKALVFIKKALLKGLESGVLSRAAKSRNVVGASGFFIISEKESKKTHKTEGKEKSKDKDGDKRKPAKTVSAESDTEERKAIKVKKDNGRKTKVTKPTNDANTGNKITKPGKQKLTKVPSKEAQQKDVKTNARGRKAKINDETKETKPFTSNVTRKVKDKKPSASKMNPVLSRLRKDLSDTELEVNRTPRKSVKSYSSDTEIEVAKSAASKRLQTSDHEPKKGAAGIKKNIELPKKGRKVTHTAAENVNVKETSKQTKTLRTRKED